jgi:uncharacterized membrane protein affecting hemolysin expression/class 3 adenylate cyclase
MAIRHKLAIAFGLLFIVLITALWLVLKLQLDQAMERQSGTLGRILARQAADSVTELVLANDRLGLNVVLGQLAREPGVASVSVRDVDGTVLASVGTAELAARGNLLRYQAPVTLQDAVAGVLSLELDPRAISNPLLQPHVVFYSGIVLALLLVAILAWYMAAHILQPIEGLLEPVDDDEEAVEPLPLADTALLELRERFLTQSSRLAELEELVASTALPDPAEVQESAHRAERRMASFLVVEAINVLTAVELLHPANLSTLLQEYQFFLRQAARLYRGVVLRVEGHRMLVGFDSRRCHDEHAFNAVCCGQLFLSLMDGAAKAHRERQGQFLEFHALVHSGDAFFSPVWKKRQDAQPAREESAIGRTVDLCYELLGQAPASTLLVSGLALDLAGGNRKFPEVSCQELPAQGDMPALPACTLTAEDGVHAELLKRQTEHLLGKRKHGQAG